MKKGKIVIVDDEKGVRESVKMILKDDYNLSIFTQAEEALKEFREDMADVVLLDIKMPGMNGIELLKRLKEIDEDIEVIMITGYGTLDSATEAMRYGASAYINKPFNRNEFLEIIKERIKKKGEKRKE